MDSEVSSGLTPFAGGAYTLDGTGRLVFPGEIPGTRKTASAAATKAGFVFRPVPSTR
jgi:hypothetical protein